MSQNKNFFRTVYDAMVESRSRQAARQVEMFREPFRTAVQKTKR